MTTNPLRNQKIFGLDVNRLFADVRDRNAALNNINLPPPDLEIIFGSAAEGGQPLDWRSFSRLTEPLHETLDRFDRDSGTFGSLVDLRAGSNSPLFGNLAINGALSGAAIRYRYVEGTGGSAVVKFADISTSRVSAWSSSDSRANNPNLAVQGLARISYGARITISSGGKLVFGTQSTATQALGNATDATSVQPGIVGPAGQPRLQTTQVPQLKEFDSEFPTHKIQATIDGTAVQLYAMKGIPVIFKGFFRTLSATVKLDLINGIPASWKIVETGNANAYSNYPNQGNTTSSISYSSSISRERFIQFYYSPDNIREITIRSANISELPAVKFKSATSFDFAFNNIRNFPTFTDGSNGGIAENLNSLFFMNNPVYLSDTESERKLQNTSYNGSSQTTGTFLDKIPTGLKTIAISGTVFGSITQNIFANRFPTLINFDMSYSGGGYFHPDSVGTSVLPNVPNTVETYGAANHDFRAIDTGAAGSGNIFNITQLTNLTSISLSGNYYLTGAFSIAANNAVIASINISATGLTFPANVANKQSLQSFSGSYSRGLGPLVDLPGTPYVFDNCTGLTSINLYAASGISGSRFPIFTNPALSTIDMRYTGVRGGGPDGDDSVVISKDTFKFATSLTAIYIDSGNLLADKAIEFEAFQDLTQLGTIWYRSYGRTNGAIPSFSGNPNLSSIYMPQNAFIGNAPSFITNSTIYAVNLSFNKLNGIIPAYRNLTQLYELYLQSNELKSISTFENLPNLKYLYIQDNLIGQIGDATIPDLTGCPNLQYFIAYNNLFRNYTTGAFSSLTSIRIIDLSDNPLTQQTMEKILEDLFENYKSANRGNVTINLRGCGQQSDLALETVVILRSKGWNVTID